MLQHLDKEGSAVPSGLTALFEKAFSFAGEILKLPTSCLKGIADSHVNIVVRIRNLGIPCDRDVGGAGHREM